MIALVFGFVIFGFCFIKLRSGRDFDRDWLNWIVLIVGLCGLVLFTYGMYIFAELK